jgi:hypothetical protein
MSLHSDTLYWQSADRYVAPLWHIILSQRIDTLLHSHTFYCVRVEQHVYLLTVSTMCQSGATCLSADCQYNVSEWSDMSICWLSVQCVRVKQHSYLLTVSTMCQSGATYCTDSQQIDMSLHSDILYWQSADRYVAPLWHIILTVSR